MPDTKEWKQAACIMLSHVPPEASSGHCENQDAGLDRPSTDLVLFMCTFTRE